MRTSLFYLPLLFASCLHDVSSQRTVKILGLDEGKTCRKGDGRNNHDFVCVPASQCKALVNSLNKNRQFRNDFDICAFDGSLPIVCCPPTTTNDTPPGKKTKNTYSADEMCRQYSELSYGEPKDDSSDPDAAAPAEDHAIEAANLGDNRAEEKHFPHMALIGYGSIVYQNTKLWGCSGSLISNKWILTAGHCKYMGEMLATWARLGVSSGRRGTGKDYKILQHVVHQGYKAPSRYNDIALFSLDTEVEFSKYVKPICINSNQLLNPKTQIATGWGRTSARLASNDLLRVDLNTVPAHECNSSYYSINNIRQLEFGINPEKMICAVPVNDNGDTCLGDTGGPLQVENFNNMGMYMQFGIKSFGRFCGDKDAPGVYTRVSNYVSAIEGIVWPKFRTYSMNIVTSIEDCEKYISPLIYLVSGNECQVQTHIESNLL